jgi:branched-chain amino acid transport system permease protein
MNFGSKLFEGTPQEARADAGVRAAYLGNAA